MIPGIDFRAFGHNARARARAVYGALARRYTQLAQEMGVDVPALSSVTYRAAKAHRPTSRSFAQLADPAQPPPRPRGDLVQEAAKRERVRLNEVFTLAHERGAVDFALRLLAEDCRPRDIVAALRSMPKAAERRHGGLAARIAARDALAAVPPPSDSTQNATAAELIRAYNKALGIEG